MKTIEYPMSTDNVSHWGAWEMCRELIQNAMDTEEWSMDYCEDASILTINSSSIMTPECLLLGHSIKDAGSRGQYGEGMKLAMIVALRLDRRIEIHTGTQLWVPHMRKHSVIDSSVMAVDITESDVLNGTRVDVSITSEEWELVQSRIIDSYGLVEAPEGTIFVGGLYVCKLENFQHAYNFEPSRIYLNRDRDVPSQYDVQYEATRLIQEASQTGHRLVSMCVNGSPEISSYAVRDDTLASGWESLYPETMPIGVSEQGHVKSQGAFKVVPDWVARKIRAVRDYLFQHTKTPLERLEELFEKNKYQLSEPDRLELEDIIKEMRGK